jgi:RHS repeat-associated protein
MEGLSKRLLAYFLVVFYFLSLTPAHLYAEGLNEIFDTDHKVVHGEGSAEVRPDQITVITQGDARILIPKGAVRKPVTIEMIPLSQTPATNGEMTNVTEGAAAYRMLPDGMQFEKDVYLTLPYDPSLIDTSEQKHIGGYYYDTTDFRYKPVERVQLDKKRHLVTSATDHFTDYINGTLSLPESPGPLGFNPNSIKDLKAAQPLAGIPGIEGLTPNNMGAASFSLPLHLPAGRGGAGVQLALSYNSQGGNSWLGTGFDLTVPAISIDTTFGVPKYDGTETYLYGGEILEYLGETIEGSQFAPRREGAFSRIIRKGSTPATYSFEVTTKDGVKQIFGASDAPAGGALAGPEGRFKWNLERVETPVGNYVTYRYVVDQNYTYLSEIQYSGHPTLGDGEYLVEFDLEARSDRRSDGRGGFLSTTALRLSRVRVSFQSQLIRQYVPVYGSDIAGKTVLIEWQERDADDVVFYTYEFAYHEPEIQGDGYRLFEETQSLGQGIQSHMYGSESLGGGGGVGVQIKFFSFFGASLGGIQFHGGFNFSNSSDFALMMDLDGDGLPDGIEQDFWGAMTFQKNNYENMGSEVSFPGFTGSMNEQTQTTVSGSGGGSFLFASASFGGSVGYTRKKSGFADFNGDGLVDIMESNKAYYYRNTGSEFVRTNFTENTGATSSGPAVVTDLQREFHPTDAVRLWLAPYPGTVNVSGEVRFTGDPESSGAQAILYNENTRVWSGRDNSGDFGGATLPPAGEIAQSILVGPNRLSDSHSDEVSLGKGEGLYFRVGSMGDIVGDAVEWDPSIRYTSVQLFEELADYSHVFIPNYFTNAEMVSFTSGFSSNGRTFFRSLYTYDDVDNDFTRTSTLASLTAEQQQIVREDLLGVGAVSPVYLNESQYEQFVNTIPTDTINGNVVSIGAQPEDYDRYFITHNYRYEPWANRYALIDRSSGSLYRLGLLFYRYGGSYSPQIELGSLNGFVQQDEGGYYVAASMSNALPSRTSQYYTLADMQSGFAGLAIGSITEFGQLIGRLQPDGRSGESTRYVFIQRIGGSYLVELRDDAAQIIQSETFLASAVEGLGIILNYAGTNFRIRVSSVNDEEVLSRIPMSFVDEALAGEMLPDPIDVSLYDLAPADFAVFYNYNIDNDEYDLRADLTPEEELELRRLLLEHDYFSLPYEQLDNDTAEIVSGEEVAARAFLNASNMIYFPVSTLIGTRYEAGISLDVIETEDVSSNSELSFHGQADSGVQPVSSMVRLFEVGNDGIIIERPIYLHVFQAGADYSLTQYDPMRNPSAGAEEYPYLAVISRMLNGGGGNFFYYEWNGLISWDANLLGAEQTDITQRPPYYAMYADNDSAQFLGKLMWHGQMAETVQRSREGSNIITTRRYDASIIDGARMVPSRMGGLSGQETVDAEAVPGSAGGNLGYIQRSSNSNTTVTAGVNIGVSLSASNSNGTSEGSEMLLDINGDRYPDKVFTSEGQIRVTLNDRGLGFGETITLASGNYLTENDNHGWNFGLSQGISPQYYSTIISSMGNLSSLKQDKASLPDSGQVSISPSASGGFGISYSDRTVQDINGDGLSDFIGISGSTISGSLGLGYETTNFSLPYSAGLSEIQSLDGKSNVNRLGFRSSYNLGFSVGIGIGFGGAGFSVGMSGTNQYSQLIDINGDGLPDRVQKNPDYNYFEVLFNDGDSFGAPVKLYTPSWNGIDFTDLAVSAATDNINEVVNLNSGEIRGGLSDDIDAQDMRDASTSLVSTGNRHLVLPKDIIGFTSGLTLTGSANVIGSWGWPVTVSVSADGSVSYSRTVSNLQLTDYNGDGLPDHVFRDNHHNHYQVKENAFAKVGLLKSISTPGGAEITLDYEASVHTVFDPNHRWVLTSVTRDRGIAHPDSEPVATTTYKYQSGFYDRETRRFYGYAIVTEISPSSAQKRFYYYNTTFSQQGIMFRGESLDSSSEIQSVIINEYSEVFPYPSNLNVSWFQLTEISGNLFELETNHTITTRTTYEYDSMGNISLVRDFGNVATLNDDMYVTMNYESIPAKHIYSLITELHVQDAQGSTVRQRYADYNDNGSLERFEFQLFGGVNPEYQLFYDIYGNLVRIVDPIGYEIIYDFDPILHFLPTSTTDSHGNSSTVEYDYLSQEPIRTIDVAGNTMVTDYDSFGRTIAVWTDYDDKGNGLPAVSYEYFPDERPARAVTYNKVSHDSLDNETITTVTFSDGIGELLQLKKEAVVYDPATKAHIRGMQVGGMIVYDLTGKIIQEGQPTFEDNYSEYFIPDWNLSYPTLFEYDSRGRRTATVLSGNIRTETSYTMQNNDFIETTIDPEGKINRRFFDIRENITRLEMYGEGEIRTTLFQYSVAGELLSMIDPQGNSTIFKYDSVGRQISIDSPDAGLREFVYDEGSRLIREYDNNLRSVGQAIEYEYDYHQLTRVRYPNSPDEIKTYEYGRLKTESNGVESTEYFYGALGELVQTNGSINAQEVNRSDLNYTFMYNYTYQGQLNEITYPDLETVRYHYDEGGKVRAVEGIKSGISTFYVEEIGYDHFGQRNYVKYGNGSETEYEYDPVRRWLTNLRSTDGASSQFQNLAYSFDDVGNITGIDNHYQSNVVSQSFTYDDFYQISSARGNYIDNLSVPGLTATSQYQQSYSFDSIGNMVRKSSSGSTNPGGVIEALNYSFTYEYDDVHPHRAKWIGDYKQSYDANGNLISSAYLPDEHAGELQIQLGDNSAQSTMDLDKGKTEDPFGPEIGYVDEALTYDRLGLDKTEGAEQTRESANYEWNERNRLIKSVVSGRETTYEYDATGIRTSKFSENSETLYAEKYYSLKYQGVSVTATKHIFLGSTRLSSRLINMDNPNNFFYEEENTYYYHGDHLGNTNFVTDYQGVIYEHMEYTPYGEVWIEESSDILNKIEHTFNSKEMDEETGFYYFGSRYLDPRMSRWISSDPAASGMMNPNDKSFSYFESMNPYGFVSNNPLRYIDPNGNDQKYSYTLTGQDHSLNIVRSLMTQSGDPDLMRMAEASRTRSAEGHVDAYRFVNSKVAELDQAFSSSNVNVSSLEVGDRIDFSTDFVNSLLGITSTPGRMNVSQAGANFIANYEQFSARSYADQGGKMTIGYGHLIKPGENFSQPMSQADALTLFRADLSIFVDAVNDGLTVSVTQAQFDALVSFAFNVGPTGFKNSSLLASINRGASQATIEANLKAWKNVNGRVSNGLVNRRADEWELYSEGDYSRDH